MKRYDAIVVGGGVNGLTTAACLGKSGRKVVLLEKNDTVGGLASTEQFADGYKSNTVIDSVPWINEQVVSELELENHGLRFTSSNSGVTTPAGSGKVLTLSSDSHETVRSIAQFSQSDADKWPAFCNKVAMLTDFLKPLYGMTPLPIPELDLSSFLSMKPMLAPYRKHGRKALVELLRILPMCMLELLDEWFESEPLRGTLAVAGIRHMNQGPMAVGTAFVFLHNHVGTGGSIRPVNFIDGGTEKLVSALESSAKSYGVELLTGSEVKNITVDNGTAVGVTLKNGEEVESHCVVSSLDPKTTFQGLVGNDRLSPQFSRRIKNIKMRGATARVHYTLKELPNFDGLHEELLKGIVSISPSLSYIEKASDASKYGRISKEPWIEFTVSSLREKSFAPAGKHVLSATVQYAPYHLRGTDWQSARDELGIRVSDVLEQYAPGFRSLIEHQEMLTPEDLKSRYGLTEGNLNQGEMMLDQFFFMRPTIDSAQYLTPVGNLYLCGAATHPGGGLHCTNGHNAANEIIKHLQSV